jgi:hypothetical protein
MRGAKIDGRNRETLKIREIGEQRDQPEQDLRSTGTCAANHDGHGGYKQHVRAGREIPQRIFGVDRHAGVSGHESSDLLDTVGSYVLVTVESSNASR